MKSLSKIDFHDSADKGWLRERRRGRIYQSLGEFRASGDRIVFWIIVTSLALWIAWGGNL